MDEDRAARAAKRRATWAIEALPTAETVDDDTPAGRLARLEALRIAACVMSGRAYPAPSTPEERRLWPFENHWAVKLAIDFVDLLRCLNDAGAHYLLVGGYAVNAYGYVRATEDLDVWVRASPDNAARVLAALDAFGMPPGVDPALFQAANGEPPTGFRFGRRPISIDLLTSIQGVQFDAAWAARESLQLDNLEVSLIGKEHLLKAKRACGRPKDLADIAALTGESRLGA